MANNMCPLKRALDKTNVIYKYTCPQKECSLSNNNSYIGFTTCKLTRRITYHMQNGSILDHGIFCNNANFNRKLVDANIEILYQITNFRRLEIMEAILIKKHKPKINEQKTGTKRILYLYG